MKQTKLAFLIIGFAFILTNCASIGVGGPDAFGVLYSDVTRSESMQMVRGPKKGMACQKAFVGLAAIGDASITSAAEKGDITNVQSVSYKEQKVLLGILYRKNCTIVTGN